MRLSLLSLGLLVAFQALLVQSQVPENFECPPGTPQYDSRGLVCSFSSDQDWLQCIYDNYYGEWRLGCLNSSALSPGIVLPPPPPATADAYVLCANGTVIDPFYDLDCLHNATKMCYYNSLRNDYIVNCSCLTGWTGLRCDRCATNDACKSSINADLSETALPCDTGPQTVFQKFFECNATDKIIQDQLGGGKITASINAAEGTGSVIIFARPTGPPPLFTCNVTGCVASILEEADGLTYVYQCEKTHCTCPFLPGTNSCKDQATADTAAVIQTRASVRCKDTRPGPLQCVFDQTELAIIVNVECIAAECAQPPSYESQVGSVVGQVLLHSLPFLNAVESLKGAGVRFDSEKKVVGIFLAILVLMSLPAFIWLIYKRITRIGKPLHPRKGASVEFASLKYEIELGGGTFLPSFLRCCKRKNLLVLDNVYGAAYPGELCCILGESGSGKTSLLDILAGMDKTGSVSGQILIDGRKRPRDFKLQAGYVQQNDAMLGTLTVEEQLLYSAELRLPSNVSRADKEAFVKETMDELGILPRRDTFIGSSEKRGISGGEKRRVSIATELVSQPRVLFLDEPTSGLDASRALSVMTLLKSLTIKHGQTIMCSIHQPRSNIFQLFDRVILLAKGKVIYSGPRSHVIKFFKHNGYSCPKGFNHADFLIDTVTSETEENLRDLALNASKYYAETQLPQQNVAREEKVAVEDPSTGGGARGQRPGWGVQVALLTHRAFLNLWRNPVLLKTHGIATIIIALFLGAAYYNLSTNISGFQNRAGSLFFVIVMLSFSCLSALDLFISERPIFIRERANGCYETGPYFIAKIFTDLVPLRVLLPTIFATIMFWMADYSTSVVHFVRYLLVIVLVNFTCASMLFVISTLSRSLAAATFISSIIILVMLLFSGLLLNFDSIPVWIGWLRYVSFLGYAYEAVIVNELAGLAIDVDISAAEAQGGLTLSGSIFLEAFAFKIENYWPDVGILAMWGVFYLLLAYVALRLFVKYKS